MAFGRGLFALQQNRFGYIATIDERDDWTDPEVWMEANPSLGVTVNVDDLKRQIDEAKEMPAQ